jgi:AcrR family transcriptional regulator
MPKLVDHAERRLDLARTVCRCLESEGVHGLRLRSVARAAGVTTGAIAHYFESKDELITAALDVATAESTRRGEAEDPTDLNGLVELLLAGSPSKEHNLRGWRVWMSFWSLTASDERLAAGSAAKYDEWIALVERALRKLASEGKIADVELDQTALNLVAMVDGLAVQACLDVSSWPVERQRSVTRDCVERLLRPPDGP